MSRIAVVYFSWSWGNTEGIALRIQEKTDADLYPIQTVVPYPRVEDAVVRQAKEEVFGKQTPSISYTPIDYDECDLVLIGSPVWWLSMAPPVRTFITENITSLRYKRVGLFITRAKWPGTALDDMHSLLQGCEIAAELDCEFGANPAYEMVTPQRQVDAWIENAGSCL